MRKILGWLQIYRFGNRRIKQFAYSCTKILGWFGEGLVDFKRVFCRIRRAPFGT
jgi:hypothetical protein